MDMYSTSPHCLGIQLFFLTLRPVTYCIVVEGRT